MVGGRGLDAELVHRRRVVRRDATLKLTTKDKEAARLATLDSNDGAIRKDGSL